MIYDSMINNDTFPVNMRRWPNIGLLLGQRRRRWTNSKPTLGQRFRFAVLPFNKV